MSIIWHYTSILQATIINVLIETVEGDITEENTEAIINPTDAKFSKYGAISSAIVNKGGYKIQEDFALLKELNGFAMTGAAGTLKCKQIIHLLSPQNINECQNVAQLVLIFASQMGVVSLSVPLFGAGGSNLPRNQVATSITDAAVGLASRGELGTLNHIRLIGYTSAEKAAFDEALKRSLKSGTNPKGTDLNSAGAVGSGTIMNTAVSLNPADAITASKVVAPSSKTLSPFSCNMYGVRFEVIFGSLIDEATDAIVNPSNDKLEMRSDLEKAIARKGGDQIQKECKYFKSIPIDGAVVTSGGLLACRYIIHILSPTDFFQCQRAVKALIQKAASNKIKSIAVPFLSTIEAQLPGYKEAKCIVDILVDAAANNFIGRLNYVRLVASKIIEKDAFQNALQIAIQRHNQLNNEDSSFTSQAAAARADVAFSQSQAQNLISTVNGVDIVVLQGDIAEEATSVIVHPSDEKLSLTSSLSKTILSKGGPPIAQECKAIGTLKGAVLTSAGNLKCTQIMHVLAPRNTTECRIAIQSILELCIKQQCVSISIPPLDTSGVVSIQEVASSITDELVDCARQGDAGRLQQVRLVAATASEKTVFEEALEKSLKQVNLTDPKATTVYSTPISMVPIPTPKEAIVQPAESSPQPPTAPMQSAFLQNPPASLSENINGITLEVATGNLVDEHTDAIVNPTNEKLELTGAISREIVSKGGSAIADECRALVGSSPAFGAFVTTAGKLPCKMLVHVISPSDRNECQQAVIATIHTCLIKNFQSIAFPNIFSGSQGFSMKQVASCIVQTLFVAAKKKSLGGLKLVRLVGSTPAETSAFESALRQALQDINGVTAAIMPDEPLEHVNLRDPNEKDNFVLINGVRIEVLKGDISKEITNAIVNPTDAMLSLNGRVSIAIVTNGGQSIGRELQSQKSKDQKEIIMTGHGKLSCGFIIHALTPASILGLQRSIKAIFELASSKGLMSLSIPLFGILNSVQLELEADCLCKAIVEAAEQKIAKNLYLVRLVGYNKEETTALENALKNNTAKFGGDKNESFTEREISVHLPDSWSPMPNNTSWLQVQIRPQDADSKEAQTRFVLKRFKLQNAFRIQNPSLYAQYAKEKRAMEKKYSGSQWPQNSGIESQLYYGTDEATANIICASGFDERCCRRNETAFGNGIYFTSDMDYAAQSSFAQTSSTGGKKGYRLPLPISYDCTVTALYNKGIANVGGASYILWGACPFPGILILIH